jgi:tetratricopeptide (TPR) repeat protein
LDAALDTVAENHSTDPRRLSHELRGELDWIVMKALEKDRDRRYESASELAQDIQRYLNDEAVEACPPSAVYRGTKFARRHKTGLAAIAFVSLAIITGMTIAFWQARVARKAAAQVTAEKDRAQKILDLALDAVDDVSATLAGEQSRDAPLDDLAKTELMQRTRQFFEGLVQVSPTSFQLKKRQANAYRRLGYLHQRLGDIPSAESDFAKAATLFQQLAASYPEEPEFRLLLGMCYLSRGSTLFANDCNPEATNVLDRAVMTLADLAANTPDHPDYTTEWAHALSMRGICYRDTGRPHISRSLEDFRAAIQAQYPIVTKFPERTWSRFILVGAYYNYAVSLGLERRFDEAFEHFRKALDQNQRLLQDQPTDPTFRWHVALIHERLADCLARAGQWEEAAIACQQSNELHTAVTADFPKIPLYRMTYVNSLLSSALVRAHFEEWSAAEQHYRLAVAQAEQMVALSDQDYMFCVTWVNALLQRGTFYLTTAQHEEAEQVIRRVVCRLEQLIARAPANAAYNRSFISGVLILAALMASDDRYDEATSLQQHAEGVLDDVIAAVADKKRYSAEERALALNNLAWLLSATPLEASRDPVGAVTLANEAVRVLPRGDTWNTAGLAYYRARLLPKAIDALDTSLEILGDVAFAYNAFPMAMIHWQSNDKDESHRWYERGAEWMKWSDMHDPVLMLLRAEAAELIGVQDEDTWGWPTMRSDAPLNHQKESATHYDERK